MYITDCSALEACKLWFAFLPMLASARITLTITVSVFIPTAASSYQGASGSSGVYIYFCSKIEDILGVWPLPL